MELKFLDKSIEIKKVCFAENNEKLIQVFELVDNSFFIKSTLKKDNYEQFIMLSRESFQVFTTLSAYFFKDLKYEQVIEIGKKFEFSECINDKFEVFNEKV